MGNPAREDKRGAIARSDAPKIVDWYVQGKIAIEPIITHTPPLFDINEGFELMRATALRSAVIY